MKTINIKYSNNDWKAWLADRAVVLKKSLKETYAVYENGDVFCGLDFCGNVKDEMAPINTELFEIARDSLKGK